jgi:hypothetical protein
VTNLARQQSETCVVCKRTYGNSSKPRWAFDERGNLAGTMHTSCDWQTPYWSASGEMDLDAARFEVWCFNVYRVDLERDGDAWFALLLADGVPSVDGSLTRQQEDLVQWWTVRGGLHLGRDRAAGIVEAYRAMVARYRAWVSALSVLA